MDKRAIDIGLGGAVVFSAFALLGVGNVELLGYDLTEAAFVPHEGIVVNYHHLITVLAMGTAWVVEQPTWARLSESKKILIIGSIVLLAASVVFTETIESVFDNTAMQIIGVTIATGGYWGIYSA